MVGCRIAIGPTMTQLQKDCRYLLTSGFDPAEDHEIFGIAAIRISDNPALLAPLAMILETSDTEEIAIARLIAVLGPSDETETKS
jgi:hypothetical protein